jgi:hypothetical protein
MYQAKSTIKASLQRYWQAKAPKSYQDLWITSSPWYPDKLYLPCHLLACVLAAQTRHGNFADYYE